jgi:hypothetical protein
MFKTGGIARVSIHAEASMVRGTLSHAVKVVRLFAAAPAGASGNATDGSTLTAGKPSPYSLHAVNRNGAKVEKGQTKNPMEYFELGQVLVTPGAQAAMSPDDVHVMLTRHAHGDWGTVPDEDKESNDRALTEGERLLSAYQSSSGVKVWVITEADRSATTLLLPDEY